jgi:YVTN family beta-propeller protein
MKALRYGVVFATMLLAAAALAHEPGPSLRRPMALALAADESLLYVANRDSGTVSIIDAKTLKLLNESPVAKKLTDLVRAGAKQFLATDPVLHELSLLCADRQTIHVCSCVDVSPYPQDVVVSRDGRTAYVSSLWSRRVSVVDVPDLSQEAGKLRVVATIDLPFPPRKQLLVDDERTLIVGDNFAGRLAIIDCGKRELKGVRTFFAENIRGMGVDPKSGLLAIGHTMLNEYAHTIQNDVHWGVLMSNDLRWLRLNEVIDPAGDFYNKGHMHPLGQPGMGGADPGELSFFADGTVVVPMGGVDKVAFGKESDFGMHRVNVGRCPTTVLASDVQRKAFIANTFDDTISVLDIEQKEIVATISLGPLRELTAAERGEALFRHGKLSHDGWMTCHTCHNEGHAHGGLNDNFSDKSFGAPKRVLSLLGVKDTAPYAWSGTTKSLADQVRLSSKETMQGRGISDDEVASLVAYLETLEVPPPVDTLRGARDEPAITRGKAMFEKLECSSCHAPQASYTTPETYDVGIHDKQGNTHFNPPSLRGVGQRGPYFHDASAATLEEVFTKTGHQLEGRTLSEEELRDLVAFLRSL